MTKETIKIGIITNEKDEIIAHSYSPSGDYNKDYQTIEITEKEYAALGQGFWKYIDNEFVRNVELEEQNRIAQERALAEHEKQLTTIEQQKLQLINTKALSNINLSADEISFIEIISEKLGE